MTPHSKRPLQFRDLLLAATACLALAALPRPAASQEDNNSRCFKCHGETWIADMRPKALGAMVRLPAGEPQWREESEIPALYTPADKYAESAHGGMDCGECHTGIDKLPHDQKLEAKQCGECHDEAVSAISQGMHNPGIEDGQTRPKCTDCHGSAHELRSIRRPRGVHQAIDLVETCGRCHGQIGAQELSREKSFHDSIHGEALYEKGLGAAPTCSDCHGYHEMLRVSDPRSPLYLTNVPETCGSCHEGVAEVYETSVHGQHLKNGDENAATCTSCHHSHGIHEIDDEFLLQVVQECSHCHLELGESYVKSYHGKATQLGYAQAAVCSSCHGYHDILPQSDPRSRVNEANLVATCEKCHENANENFVNYLAHVDYTDPNDSPPVFWTFAIMTTLLLSVLAVFLPHTFLWFQRTIIGRFQTGKPLHHHITSKERMVERFSPIHRFTHLLIIVSFMGLVATGFPLKYSYTQWAHDLTAAFGGIHVMGLLHRGFALITFAYAGVHAAFLVYFFLFKCPRPRWRYVIGPESMLFSWRDFKDFLGMLKWFFWRSPRPKLDRWAYFEKFDYWGEIWGVFIIGGSGMLLWFPEFFTRWLPGWVLNCAMVVHSIEALLAASVIFLVHFFNTHLRPEKFPVDLVMFTGQMSEEEMEEERGAEYERLKETGELESRIVPTASPRYRLVGAVMGIIAFAFGLFLIFLAATTEIGQFMK